MLEREGAIAELTAALELAFAGRGQVVVVEGPAGIGKTRLLTAAASEARQRGGRVLHARGVEVERDVAFGGVRQLLDPVVRGLPQHESDRLFAGAATPARRLFGGPGTQPDSADPFAMLNALYWMIAVLTDATPLLVSVDDAHWLDRPSKRLVDFLASRIDDLRLLVIAATRPVDGVGQSAIASLVAEPGTRVIRPEPLSRVAVATIVREHFPEADDTFVTACSDVTAGNPFYLNELVRELTRIGVNPSPEAAATVRTAGPRTISLAVRFRSTSSDDEMAVARAVAVLGDDARLQDAAALAGVAADRARAAADLLVRESILRPGTRLAFVHPIVRAAIYAELGPQARARAHGDAARLVHAAGFPLERVAAHLLQAEPDTSVWAVDVLRRAAANAMGNGAPDAAAQYLRRALAEPPDAQLLPRVLLELARAEALAAEPAAPEHFEAAYAAAVDPVVRAEIAVTAALILFQTGRIHEAVEMLADVADELRERNADAALEVEAQLVALAVYEPSVAAAHRPRLERVPEDIEGTTRGSRMMLSQLAYRRLLDSRDAERAAQLAERAIGRDILVREHGTEGFELTSAALTLILGDRVEASEELLEAALTHARERGSRHGFAHVSFLRSELAYRLGRIADVEAEAQASLDIALPSGLAVGAAIDAAMLVFALVERGHLGDAHRVLAAIGFDEGDVPVPVPYNYVLSARGRLRIADGKLDAGLEDLHACGRRNRVLGIRQPLFCPWRGDAALAHRARGENDEAVDLAEEELRAARDWGTPGTLGSAQRLIALVSRPGDTIDALRAATTALALSPARLEHARALVDLGAALRRANNRADARQPLLEGLELAETCGAGVLARRARDELAAMGARPRRSRLTGADALTASERRVAQLAVRGLSNIDIAQTLFVTRKTVEKHLGNVYAKLGVRSRNELARHFPRAAA